MSFPHGFKAETELRRYLKCLENIKEHSKLGCIWDGYLRNCEVFSISSDRFVYHSSVQSDFYHNKRVILFSKEDAFGFATYDWPASYVGLFRNRFGAEVNRYRYAQLDSRVFITKIDNKQ